MFHWNNDELNSEQERAIREEGNILLIACPGSGKTRTLTYKIAHELSKIDSEKKFIVAITYTNNAADEIKERIETLGVDTKQLWIGTIHSFCLEWILRPYSLYLEELKNGFRVINSHDTEELLSELCVPYRYPRISYWHCERTAIPGGYNLRNVNDNIRANVEAILEEYHSVLKQNNQIDFEQILFYSNKLLIENPLICKILSNLFAYILIDEYQDTKEIQYHIIASIIKAGAGDTKFFIVGDPNQSIYNSLGGFPMSKDELEGHLGLSLEEHSLESNYRSSSKIIDYFEYFKTYPNAILSVGKDKDYPSSISFNTVIEWENIIEELVRLILYNVEDKGISPEEICIVAPQWIHLAGITRELMVRLPNMNFDGPGMAPFSRDIENFWYKLSRIILTEPSPNLYLRRLRWSDEIIKDLHHAHVDVSSINKKKFLKICNSVNINEDDGIEYLKKVFEQICLELRIDLEAHIGLKEHYHSFFESANKRIEKLRNEGNEFIGTTENFKKVFKQRNGITISSIHNIKGTEYDTMIGFGLLQGYVPHSGDNNGEDSAKKLLYVLCSRAKKNLHLISGRGRFNNWNPRREYQPTVLLSSYDYPYDEI